MSAGASLAFSSGVSICGMVFILDLVTIGSLVLTLARIGGERW